MMTCLSLPVIFGRPLQGDASLVNPVLLSMLHVYLCHTVLYAPCSIIVTCRERAGLLALLCDVFLVFCHFPIWCFGSGLLLDCIDS